MATTVLLVEEPPVSMCACDVAQVLAAEGFVPRRIEWNDTTTVADRPPLNTVILVFPSAERLGRSTLLDWVQRRDAAAPVIVVVPEGGDSSAALGSVDDFLVAPVRAPELLARLRRLQARLHVEVVKNHLAIEFIERQLIGTAPAFRAAVNRARLIAADESPVLITGETGTGKELFARAIHHLGRRRERPFIPVDCAALPDHLFENEMFGHERGAYTDARGRQEGLAALAEGGTLFLDEVNSLSLAHQAKLLRFLQDKTYRPLGASTYRTADVRITAATNRDLEHCVQARAFRQDLYFRLNVLDLHLPPLCERTSDIALLASHFLAEISPDKAFSPDALNVLSAYNWPGNVRELHNTVCRVAAFAVGRRITSSDIALPKPAGVAAARGSFREARAQALEHFERTYLQGLLADVGGNITQAAKQAGKERRAIGRLVQKHHLK